MVMMFDRGADDSDDDACDDDDTNECDDIVRAFSGDKRDAGKK
jgi:hypothetical protein